MSKSTNIIDVIAKLEQENETIAKWSKHYEIEKQIIQKIINKRKSLNMTQQELARLTGLKQPAIARIEKQVNSPTLSTLITIIDELNLKFELLCLEEYDFIKEQHQEYFNEILNEVINLKIKINSIKEIGNGGNSQHENNKHIIQGGINNFA